MACFHHLGTLNGSGGVRVLTCSPYLLEYGHIYGNWWLAIGSDCWLITCCYKKIKRYCWSDCKNYSQIDYQSRLE